MNKHIGSRFDDFLKEEGILDEVNTSVRLKLEKYIQQNKWNEQQRQVKENLKAHIDSMLVEEVEFSELQEDGTAQWVMIRGQLIV